jgi:hypothetical protein
VNVGICSPFVHGESTPRLAIKVPYDNIAAYCYGLAKLSFDHAPAVLHDAFHWVCLSLAPQVNEITLKIVHETSVVFDDFMMFFAQNIAFAEFGHGAPRLFKLTGTTLSILSKFPFAGFMVIGPLILSGHAITSIAVQHS